MPRPSASPLTLAAFRIAVGLALLGSSELHGAARFAALPATQRIAPEGLAWFVALVAPGPNVALATLVRALAFGSAIATILGVYTRVATLVLFLASFYLLALGQLGGTVVHDMHLVWFAAILAASRSGDALSVDAWWDAREGKPHTPASSLDYGVPVWTARALFACVYFFPGLHKVLEQGLAWASAENLALQLQWKWFEWGDVPAFRLDRHPVLLELGGVATLAFELGFPLALLHRRTRALAALGGVAFHLATDHFMRIPFSSLWLCYPVLFDIGKVEPAPRALAWPRRELALFFVLVPLSVVQGLRGKMDAFPFACYPTFAARPPTEVPDLRIVALREDGSELELAHARDGRGVRAQADWGRVWALVGATRPFDRERLVAYGESVMRANEAKLAGTTRVELRLAYYSVAPEARAGAPTRERTLATIEAAKR